MVFVVVLCHVVLKSSHLSTSYSSSVRNRRDWRGLPTAGLHCILIRSTCLEDNHSVRTSSPVPLVYGATVGARCHSEGIRRGCPKNLNLSPTTQLLFVRRPTKNPRKIFPGICQPLLLRIRYNSLRPSIAFNIVTSSAYSKSAPTGIPTPIRVTRTPSGFSSFDT